MEKIRSEPCREKISGWEPPIDPSTGQPVMYFSPMFFPWMVPPPSISPNDTKPFPIPKKKKKTKVDETATNGAAANAVARKRQKSPPKKRRKEKSADDSDDEYDSDYDLAESKGKKRPAKQKKSEACQKPRKKRRSEQKFEVMIEQLRAYKAQHGDCNVPRRQDKTSATYKLGLWVEQIRHQYRLLKRGDESAYLTLPQMVQLTEVGFSFNLRPKGFTTWEERMEQCRGFIREHGHLKIPRSHPELGIWCAKVRQDYRNNMLGKRTALTPERQQQLQDMGFVWIAGNPMPEDYWKNNKPWATRLQEFIEYKNIHGHPYVPRHLPEPKGLGRWVAEQRRLYKRMKRGEKSDMTPEKALQLKNAGFAWDASSIRRTPKSGLEHEVMESDDDGDSYGHEY